MLRAGRVSFNDILELDCGKVLRFDTSEDSPFELQVEGRPIASGRISRDDTRAVFEIQRILTEQRATTEVEATEETES